MKHWKIKSCFSLLLVQVKDDRTQSATLRSAPVTVYTREEAKPAAPALLDTAFAQTESAAPSMEAMNLPLAWESVPAAAQYGVTVELQQNGAWQEIHHAAISSSKTNYTLSAALFADITGETLCRIGLYSINLEAGETRYYYVKLTPHVIDPSLTINGASSLNWYEGYYKAAAKSFTIQSELPVTVTQKTGGDWYTYTLFVYYHLQKDGNRGTKQSVLRPAGSLHPGSQVCRR